MSSSYTPAAMRGIQTQHEQQRSELGAIPTRGARGSENGNQFSPTGHEILTWSGQLIDLRDPQPRQIFMADIAVGLAHQERFTGACHLRPTIAQHSLAVEHIAGALYWRLNRHDDDGVPVDLRPLRRAALMHDAAEYLVGDATGAVKKLMRDAQADDPYDMRSAEKIALDGYTSPFDELESAAEAAIIARFDCSPAGWEEIIHEADCMACAYEMAYSGWCPVAHPPEWLRRDIHVARCYGGSRLDAETLALDGGEAAFLRRALELKMVDDRPAMQHDRVVLSTNPDGTPGVTVSRREYTRMVGPDA